MKADEKPARKGPPKRLIVLLVVLAVCVVLAITAYRSYSGTHISTDDAFVDGRIHTIAAKISGTVKTLCVEDNQLVKKGDLIAEIDPVDYNARVDEAGASLSSEKSRLAETGARAAMVKSQRVELLQQVEGTRINLEVQRKNLIQAEFDIKKAQANLDAQEARLRQAVLDIRRADDLFAKEAISREKHENALTAKDVAEAQVMAAREQLNQAAAARDAQGARVLQAEVEIKRTEAALATQQNAIRQAEISVVSQTETAKQREAVLRIAELNRSYTRVEAPVDGYVSKRSVEVGTESRRASRFWLSSPSRARGSPRTTRKPSWRG